ncbi:hypothetical protein BaRGS_00029395 [Batillaria attramentaria]|uniref:Uncharacterized protein n=1 Tax=Batillaria attramentaria TaxID=370345 RepID=A0ABD0JW62_9CAEN
MLSQAHRLSACVHKKLFRSVMRSLPGSLGGETGKTAAGCRDKCLPNLGPYIMPNTNSLSLAYGLNTERKSSTHSFTGRSSYGGWGGGVSRWGLQLLFSVVVAGGGGGGSGGVIDVVLLWMF